MAKYLVRRGHRVTVLTSLASGGGPVPGATRTVRTRDLLTTRLNWRRASLQAMQGQASGSYREASRLESLVVPDLSVFTWLPFMAARALGEPVPDCVITTGPPQSAHLVGVALRTRGAAFVADLRDGWTFDPPQAPWAATALAEADEALERAVLGRADRVVAVTDPIAADLRERLGVRAEVVTNGFDPEDRPGVVADGRLDPGRFALVHTGRLIAAGDAPQALLEGALEVRRRRPRDPRSLEVVFAGPTSAADDRLLGDPRYAAVARALGPLGRAEALGLQRAADALVLMATGTVTRPARSIATGKLFEYLAARRPLLVLGEDSAAARIVSAAGAGVVAPANDKGAVADALERMIDTPPKPAPESIRRYGWPALAERVEAIVEEAIAARSG